MRLSRFLLPSACLAALLSASAAVADSSRHLLWQIHGKHNTVYLLGSIHVLRDSDYPLPQAVTNAYARAARLVMEIDLDDTDMGEMQQEMLGAAQLPEGQSLAQVLGPARFARAQAAIADLGLDIGMFDGYAPWFVAESISQLQLLQLGFAPDAGVEMHFVQMAHTDHKAIAGLETAHEQIELFRAIPMARQADYLMQSLQEAKELPGEVAAMVAAWRAGDTAWFDQHLNRELGRDPALYEAVLTARNRKWIGAIVKMLSEDKDCLVIVGAGHLVGRGSVIDLLQQRGFSPVQE
jgi:uncharacterized protein YbaP (TraB family)